MSGPRVEHQLCAHMCYTLHECSLMQSLHGFHKVGAIVNFILQMRKQKLREVNWPRITLLVVAEVRFTTSSKTKC